MKLFVLLSFVSSFVLTANASPVKYCAITAKDGESIYMEHQPRALTDNYSTELADGTYVSVNIKKKNSDVTVILENEKLNSTVTTKGSFTSDGYLELQFTLGEEFYLVNCDKK